MSWGDVLSGWECAPTCKGPELGSQHPHTAHNRLRAVGYSALFWPSWALAVQVVQAKHPST